MPSDSKYNPRFPDPPPKAQWQESGSLSETAPKRFVCSRCRGPYWGDRALEFCPRCGAKMINAAPRKDYARGGKSSAA
ncbi:hypothetical protein DRH29_01330 [candidate division Kazan bacterium]|uniref:Uncharacterized protein n=1 Tax=candidate division Kazan bacterium TaxID=2202143 RepID=A0A420ZDM4_UNCK3|nr:MAG: hypothetical protein DRH29_01330 [candidate division Kazan bacterium]